MPVRSSSCTARRASAGRHKADRFHFVGPFLIVIPGPRRIAEMGLPCVNHFVDDRLKDLKKRDDGKVGGIDSNFIRRSLVDGMDETPV